MAAVYAGQTIAIANKESLVSAGAVVTQTADELAPISCQLTVSIMLFFTLERLDGHQAGNIENGKIAKCHCLTASGGPF